jgi:hypothetical protein
MNFQIIKRTLINASNKIETRKNNIKFIFEGEPKEGLIKPTSRNRCKGFSIHGSVNSKYNLNIISASGEFKISYLLRLFS